MKRIFIDPGHGGNDPGAMGNGLQEKDINLDIALRMKEYLLQTFGGHEVRLSRETDKTVSLSQRTTMANNWQADYLVSIHINAGGGTGFESYIFNGIYSGKAETHRLRQLVHQSIVNETGYYDRGMKEANFHMLRESQMPAVLTENGFIDYREDANKLKSSSFLQSIAKSHATGVADVLELPDGEGASQGYVEILADSLWTYNSPEWEDKAVIVHKGEVFTVIKDKFPVGDGHMYQIKSGLYITANKNYVRYYTRSTSKVKSVLS
ncbi:N-acetylmuramoyl-L-alanine amidase [Oceanobacillus iheyensis]|uniref:N-acetylmuramoyl-L-alanine amidase (Sporulation mother cell wall hydrolase) n=1 Tax=Oceanobacillus iheyensis (strain DSM 14371 / CIP 107618 / JCM 11309 / KCTC 3954 / HTE831) TaxID=221109 RepID=Q8CVA3_OCEIH|nr:N-acetylmuramoyl-L-alanine amidase [Oceanobacillus iheyensis]BAC12810.1 N-acetylmuramoyl-L-alanine amidase (sporulation mother cell wall hydrolase) [Oceanobacillus iheyensis HTE831]